MATNIITMNRGDTVSFNLFISDDSAESGEYILQNDDKVYFGIMYPHQKFEDAIIKKVYTKDDYDSESSHNLIVTIKPEDTVDLLPGIYYYCVKLHKLTDDETDYIDEIVTVINKTKLVLND